MAKAATKATETSAKPTTGNRRKRGTKTSSDSLPAIAEESELLEMLTRILRGEITEENAVKMRGDNGEYVEIVRTLPKISTRLHCVELLGKVHGTFGGQGGEESPSPTVIFGEEDLL